MAIQDHEYSLAPVAPEGTDHAPSETSLLNREGYRPDGWPKTPRAIKLPWSTTILNLLVDLALLTVSLAFLAFALTVRHYDQVETKLHPQLTRMLREGTKYGPTVFPILFACIIARATHAILVWRLERGESVGTLDLLAGSTSLTSTVTSQFSLRILTVLGPVLVVVWALSPIGGQASLRVMTLGSQVLDQSVPIAYAKFNSTPYWQGSGAQTPLSIARYLAGASILSSIASKNGSTDLWGNVKIPYIEAYETAPEQRPDEGDWYNTSASYDTFSSLVGVPTLGVENTNSTYTFNLEANYLYLGCRWNSSDSNYFASNSFNSSGPGNDDRGEVQDQNALSIRTFVFNSKLGETICNISTTYVEVVVSCNDQAIANNGSEVPSSGCTASRVRRSRLDNPQPYYTTLDSQGQDSFSLIAQLSRIFNSEDSLPTPFDNYLLSPEDVMGLRTGFEQGTSNHGNVTDRTLSNRLGQLMNTWWTILSGLSVVSGGLSSDTARIEGLPTPSPGLLGTAFTTNTTATRTAVVEVIQSHDGWVIALCFASGLLIIASLIRPFMRHFLIRGPDILLNFSSLVARNNEYIPLASSGSFMVASERARLLKNLRVRFGDVESSADVGKLVIGGLGMVGTKAPKYLRKDRLYE